MRTCARCGNIVSDKETFCNRCGCERFNEVKPMNAPNETKIEDIGNLTQRTVTEIPKQYRGLAPRKRPSDRLQINQSQIGNLQNSIPNKQLEQMNRQQSMREFNQQNEQSYAVGARVDLQDVKGIKKLWAMFKEEHIDQSSIKNWFITLLLLCIPIFNIVYMLREIKRDDTPDYKKTLFVAEIMLMVLGVILGIGGGILLAAMII